MKRRMRLCRQRSKTIGITNGLSGKRDPVPGFPWPPPLLAELREIFRPRPRLVPPPEPKDAA